MAQWKQKVYLGSLTKADPADFRKLAKSVYDQLDKVIARHMHDEDLEGIRDDFHTVVHVDGCTVDDFDNALGALYD